MDVIYLDRLEGLNLLLDYCLMLASARVCGVVLRRIKIINENSRPSFVKLLTNLLLPCMILDSFNKPMDVEELTERFMRGDKSRNTEGSGLGLAIVKSFVELQGGSFHIEADGDLFKARMSFPKTENSSTGAAEVG